MVAAEMGAVAVVGMEAGAQVVAVAQAEDSAAAPDAAEVKAARVV